MKWALQRQVRMFEERQKRVTSLVGTPRVWLADPFCFTPWYTAALTSSLLHAGVTVRLLCSSFAREPEYFDSLGISRDSGPFHLVGSMHGPAAVRRIVRHSEILLNWSSLLLAFKRRSFLPDVMHLQQLPLLNHGVALDFQVIAAAQRAGVPVVHTVHNVLPHDSQENLRPIYAKLYKQVDHLICHSEGTAAALRADFGLPDRKLTVIPHGPLFAKDVVPTETDQRSARSALQLPNDRTIVLWQGVLAPYKGVETLLHAWGLLLLGWRSRFQPAPLLVIAGDGPKDLLEEVARQAAALGPSVHTRLGYVTARELPLLLTAADILAYPHLKVTTSGALMTGLSYGKPIVASDLPCFRDYLNHGENALLVAPGDAYDLAAAMALLLRDATAGRASEGGTYERLKKGAALNAVRCAGWAHIALQTKQLYEELLVGSARKVCA